MRYMIDITKKMAWLHLKTDSAPASLLHALKSSQWGVAYISGTVNP